MKDRVQIDLMPLGKSIEVGRGAPLQDVLFAFGVEFPCGGHGRCKACRIKLLQGSLPVSDEEQSILSPAELAEGWRLACRCRAYANLTLEINQWEAAILADSSAFEFTPGEGLGIAVDLGTTTLVAQMLDLRSGRVLAVQTGLNPQTGYGSDIMSRVQFALTAEGGKNLARLIREGIGRLIADLRTLAGKTGAGIRRIVIVGNSVMHHLFCGIDATPLAYYPFEPLRHGRESFPADALGWDVPGNPVVEFLPCLGGFVGSDILAGVLATRMHESEALVGLVDLGTNGEVVLGNRERILCASTAAGPAFEGARIQMGMRAATGAISEVKVVGGSLECRVLGGGAPRGLCGSGLVDAVAAGIELGIIEPSGRFREGIDTWTLAPPVLLTQRDVRELQLAKGAIAAAIDLLLRRLGAQAHELATMYLAGAFGNYIDRTSARRIGLIDFPEEKIVAAGNTALLGAKLALFDSHQGEHPYSALIKRIEHVPLAADPRFHEVYVESMSFPPPGARPA